MFPHCQRHHQGGVTGVGDGHLHFGHAELLGMPQGSPRQHDCWPSPSGDLYVGPAEVAPTRTEGFHDGLLSGETRRKPALGSLKAIGVFPFMGSEASLAKPRVAFQHGSNPVHGRQVNSRANNPHPPDATERVLDVQANFCPGLMWQSPSVEGFGAAPRPVPFVRVTLLLQRI